MDKELSFGTAGIRGIVGDGVGMMNDDAVARATQGFCDYLLSKISSEALKGAQKSVVIAYDSRRDSARFAETAASVAAGNGFFAYIYDDVRSTPQLSFSVRSLRCAGGIMITASHNPPEYNGYKVYGSDGCQLVPSESDEVARRFREVRSAKREKFSVSDIAHCSNVEQCGRIFSVPREIDAMYLDCVRKVSLRPELLSGTGIRAAYTPLHGVGGASIRALFDAVGYRGALYTESQMKPDGDFPTIGTPNPESAAAFAEAEKISGADLIIATDPDCDRMGIMLPGGRLLTGNEAAALFLSYVLAAKKERGELRDGDYVVSTVVSGDLPKAVAEDYGLKYEQVLTGFKYIGERIEKDPEHFVMGFEESCGYLFSPEVRDKDACMATLIAVEMAAHWSGGLAAELGRLYEKYGAYIDFTDNLAYSDPGDILERMNRVRERGIAGASGVMDYAAPDTGLPEADLVKFTLCGGGWIAFRPSGTEPKLKVYYCMRGLNDAQAREMLKKYRGIVEELFK